MEREPYIEKRPWGRFVQFTHNEPSTVKILSVLPKEELSLQYHNHREEFWQVIGGNGTVVLDGVEHDAVLDKQFFVAQGMEHQIKGGSEELHILEIATGDFDEEDIVRIKDKYNR